MTQRMADAPKVAALAPRCPHGETEDSPKPTPNINKISDSAAAATAPAKMAPHDTALASDLVCSRLTPSSVRMGLGLSIDSE